MKSSGSAYVAIVLVLLAGYFSYQGWFNPRRAIKRQLGELAETLSVPASTAEIDRVARLAQLRRFFAPDVTIALDRSGPSITSRDALVGAVASWNPPAGEWTVTFLDVQITMDSETTAHAYMTVEVTTTDPQTNQPAFDAREAMVNVAKQDGAWVVTAAESVATLQRP
jgi:hypothetical protein